MRITSDELTTWADRFYSERGQKRAWNRLAEDAGFKYITLNVQRKQNKVDPAVIVGASRTHHADPLRELATIQRFADVHPPARTPSARDLLATLNPGLIHQEIANRALRLDQPPTQPGAWDVYPHRFAAWVDATGPTGARENIAHVLRLKDSAVSARLNDTASFRIDEIIEAMTAIGLDPVFALVLGGHITPAEAGYGDTIRVQALLTASDDELLDMNQLQARYIRRYLQDLRILDEHAGLN